MLESPFRLFTTLLNKTLPLLADRQGHTHQHYVDGSLHPMPLSQVHKAPQLTACLLTSIRHLITQYPAWKIPLHCPCRASFIQTSALAGGFRNYQATNHIPYVPFSSPYGLWTTFPIEVIVHNCTHIHPTVQIHQFASYNGLTISPTISWTIITNIPLKDIATSSLIFIN